MAQDGKIRQIKQEQTMGMTFNSQNSPLLNF